MTRWLVRNGTEFFQGYGYRNRKLWTSDANQALDYRTEEAAQQAAKVLKAEAVAHTAAPERFPVEFRGRTVYVTVPEA